MSEAGILEGEILNQRFAVLEVRGRHGDWVRCRVFDMQAMAQREAVVEIGEDGLEVELLPADPMPEPAPRPESPGSRPESRLPPPPERSSAKPGRLEAAWFAAGANAEAVSEEDRPVEDGDVVIAPSRIERAATDITTDTYIRYALDPPARPAPAWSDAEARSVALPMGTRRLVLGALLVAAGAGLLATLFLLLR